MILTLVLVAALQTSTDTGAQNPPSAQAAPAAQATTPASARPQRRAQPVCQNRARTGSVLRREVCISAQQAESQQSAAKQYIEEATAGMAHEELPLGGAYKPL